MNLEKIIAKRSLELSKEIDKQRIPEHIAIIMDGNGRWATKKGLPRSYGHTKGVGVLNEYSNNRDKMINDFVVKILEKYPPISD